MQKKIIEYQKNIEKKINFKKFKFLLIGFFLILFSLFGARYVFAENNLNVVFDKTIYSIMENTSTKVEFEIFNLSNDTESYLLWTECDDDYISCYFSKRLTLSKNTSQTSSFYITGIDDSRSSIYLYVKNLKTESVSSFRLNVDILDYRDDGYFEIESYSSNLCIGKTNSFSVDIRNRTNSDLYNLYLKNEKLTINQKQQNPVFLKNKNILDYYVFVPENTAEGEQFNLIYTIENERIQEIKEITLFARKCVDNDIDFSVTGPTTLTYYLNKTDEKEIIYKIKNNSLNNKTIYISEENNEENIYVSIDKPQITLASNQTQEIKFNIRTTKDIKSGVYDLNFYFFDGINFINKKIKLHIYPEYKIEIENLNNMSQTLVIGKNLELLLLLKNKGDLRDDFTVTTISDNDLKVRISDSFISIAPYANTVIPITVFAGTNTTTGYAYLTVRIKGTNSDFYHEQLFILNVTKDSPKTTLEFLSYPKEINVLPNTTQEIKFVIKNKGNERVTIENIKITNVSQEIILRSLSEITINANETKTISLTLDIKDIKQNEVAKVLFTTDNKMVLEKEIEINLFDQELKELNKSKITGFLNLRNSMLTGIIIASITVILFFVFGIFKANRI